MNKKTIIMMGVLLFAVLAYAITEHVDVLIKNNMTVNGTSVFNGDAYFNGDVYGINTTNYNVNHSNTTSYWDGLSGWSTIWFDDLAGLLSMDETKLSDFITTLGSGLYILQTEEGNLNVNSSDYWDGLDVPTDITAMSVFTAENITDLTRLTFTNATIKQLEANSNIDGGVIGIMLTNPPNQELPHFILQSGGATQASVILRSFMIQNEINNFSNTTDVTDCGAYMTEIGEVLKIDCNTTTTGADLLVSDDLQVVGDVWLKDSEGEWHFMTRELQFSDERTDESVLNRLNTSLTGVNFTITEYEGKTIVVNVDKVNYDLGVTSDSVLLTAGTDANPQLNHVYYPDTPNPTLTANTALTSGVASVFQGMIGAAGNDFGSFGGSAQQYEFTKHVYERFWAEGPLYTSGFDIDASATNLNISAGIMKIILVDEALGATDTNSFVHIQSDGTFITGTDLDAIVQYATGEAIGNNKYYNVVFGVAHNQDQTGIMYAVIQNKPAIEYISVINAEVDSDNAINYFPSNSIVQKVYTPVARGVIKNTGGVMTLQTLSNGELFFDIRGSDLGTGGASPSPGITVHSDLSNLDYASSGHTGFIASTEEANLNVNSSTYWDDETSQANLNVNHSDTSAMATESLAMNWTGLQNYPGACEAGAVTTIGDTLTCTDAWVELAGDTMTGNLIVEDNVTVEYLKFETNTSHTINDNATCIILTGSTSTMKVC